MITEKVHPGVSLGCSGAYAREVEDRIRVFRYSANENSLLTDHLSDLFSRDKLDLRFKMDISNSK